MRRLYPRLPKGLLALLAVVALTTAAGAQTGLGSEIQILQRLAEERYADGDLERAAATYQEIASKQSDVRDQAKALFMAAWLMHLSGHEGEALTTLTRSLTLAPEQPFDATLYNRDFELLYRQALDAAGRARREGSAARTREAVTEMAAGRDDEARRHLAAAIELDPDNPSALYNLALLDLRAGASEEAMADFERVIALTYKAEGGGMTELRAKALTSMGVIYQQLGQPGDAEQAFLEATRTDAMEATAWANLGRLQMRLDRHEAAAASLERAHGLRPDNLAVTRDLASSLAGSGRQAQASATLHATLNRYPKEAGMWLQLAHIEQLRDQPTAAIDALHTAIEIDLDNQQGIAARSAILLAQVHRQAGDSAAALAAANRAIGWDRNDPNAWSELGRAQTAADQLAAAAASFGRAAELDADSLERQMEFGDTLAANNQLPQAEAAYLRALTLDPENADAAAKVAAVRAKIANQRAIVAGRVRPPKPIAPKKIGLEFAGIDYKDLQLRGALVKQVNKKSPAARAGLRKGDLILWIGDYAVLSGKDFFQYLKRRPPGDRLEIEYLRDGRIWEAELRLR